MSNLSIGANPFGQQNLQFGGAGANKQAQQSGGAGSPQGLSQAQGATGAGSQNLLAGMNQGFNPNFPRHDRMFVASA